MKVNIVSINPITHIPSMRYIVDFFLYQKKANVEITEIRINHQNNYYANITNLSFNNIAEFDNFNEYQIGLQKLNKKKYFKLISLLFHLFKSNETDLIYTNDFQVIFFALIFKAIFKRTKIKIIYHQFELIEENLQGKFSKFLYRYVLKNSKKISLSIFPEINRLNYFLTSSNINENSVFLFPNTCSTQNSNPVDSILLNHIPDNHYVVLHVGSIGDKQHYFETYLQAINNLQKENDISFVFVGRNSKDIQAIISSIQLKNIYFIDSVPHEHLASIYKRANLGVILYKGTSLNYEFCAPNKLYEFWANGIPVIGHQLKGLIPVFTQKFMGNLTDFENSSLVTSCILEMKNRNDITGVELKDYFKANLDISIYIDLFNKKLNTIL